MICTRLAIAIAASGVLAAIGNGAVIERDWVAPGDGLLTYDTVNGREWLDYPSTLLDQFGLIDTEEAIEAGLRELGPGGRFEGFTLAKKVDVIALQESAGIDTSDLTAFSNLLPADALMDLLGPLPGRVQRLILGVLDEPVDVPYTPGLANREIFQFSVSLISREPLSGLLDTRFVGSNDIYFPETTGLMLYRGAIPEPSSAALFLVAGYALASGTRGVSKRRVPGDVAERSPQGIPNGVSTC